MTFDKWLAKVPDEEPQLTEFIQRLGRFFQGEGFKAAEFEKAIENGLSNAAKNALLDGVVHTHAEDQ